MRGIVNILISVVLYANLWFAVAAGSLYATTCFAMGFPFSLKFALFLAGATLFTYAIPVMRLWPVRQINKHLSPRQIWAFRFPVLFFTISFAGFLLAIITFDSTNIFRVAPPAILALLYMFSLIKWKGRAAGLRDIFWLKNIVLTYAFVWPCVAAPMLVAGVFNYPFLLFQWFVLLSISLAFDYRDMERDKILGTQTLIGKLGYKNGLKLIHALNFTVLPLVLFWLMAEGKIPYVPLLIYLPFHIAVFLPLKKETQWNYYLAAVDGLLIAQAAIFWLILRNIA